MKNLITFIFLNLFVFAVSAQTINKTKEQVIQDMNTYADTLKGEDVSVVKEALKKADFVEGDEWDYDYGDNPRYSLKIHDNFVFKIDINGETNKIDTLWLQYPKAREFDNDVIAMKKIMGYVANYKFSTDNKLKKQFTKFMNEPYDSKGKPNYKILYGYKLVQVGCNDEIYCFVISDK